MHPINFIAQHLDQSNLKLEVVPVDTICAFTGETITEGVPNKKLIKKTFTDQAYLKYPSDYSSVAAAMCIESVISGNKGLNALRNYSYYVTDQVLTLLKREAILPTIQKLKNKPFVLVVTYANKKHTAYKTTLNTSKDNFIITTDIGDIATNLQEINQIIPILQQMYAIVPDKKHTAQQPTFFAKKEIYSGNYPSYKMNQFG
ncbi:MAG: hypothetical protein AAGJ18_23830, partial [Bacteroidota bacterium]